MIINLEIMVELKQELNGNKAGERQCILERC